MILYIYTKLSQSCHNTLKIRDYLNFKVAIEILISVENTSKKSLTSKSHLFVSH